MPPPGGLTPAATVIAQYGGRMHDLVIRGGNVVDFDGFVVGAARMARDVTGRAPQPVQQASDDRRTICAGGQSLRCDEVTGELPGRPVRGRR
jgi:hypothetical protein